MPRARESHLAEFGSVPSLTWSLPRNQAHIEKPFFPNYLFVRVDLHEIGLSALQYAPGLRRVVAWRNNNPTAVSNQIVEHLQEHLLTMNTFDQSGQVLKQVTAS